MSNKVITEEKSIYTPGYVFAPNSIHHGHLTKSLSAFEIVKVSENRLLDFIDFLFENPKLAFENESDIWLIFDKMQLKENGYE